MAARLLGPPLFVYTRSVFGTDSVGAEVVAPHGAQAVGGAAPIGAVDALDLLVPQALRIGLLAWLSALLLMLRHFDFSVTPGDGGLVTHGKKKQR